MFRIIILSGPLRGRRMEVANQPLIVGRAADCSLRLEDADATEHNASLEHKGGSLLLVALDPGSRITVNDEPVERAYLHHGDVAVVGGTRFMVEEMNRSRVKNENGLWLLHRLFAVAAMILVPVAFLYLVAYLEKTFLYLDSSPAIGSGETALSAAPIGPETATMRFRGLPVGDQLEGRQQPEGKTGVPNLGPVPSGTAAKGAKTVSPTKAQQVTKALSIVSLELTMSTEKREEVRTIDVRLRQESGALQLVPEAVRVETRFFDQNAMTGEIFPTRSKVMVDSPKPEGAWLAGVAKSVKTYCRVPRQSKKMEIASGAETYYGYVVRVYYRDKLQDEEARPKSLLQYKEPAGAE